MNKEMVKAAVKKAKESIKHGDAFVNTKKSIHINFPSLTVKEHQLVLKRVTTFRNTFLYGKGNTSL